MVGQVYLNDIDNSSFVSKLSSAMAILKRPPFKLNISGSKKLKLCSNLKSPSSRMNSFGINKAHYSGIVKMVDPGLKSRLFQV